MFFAFVNFSNGSNDPRKKNPSSTGSKGIVCSVKCKELQISLSRSVDPFEVVTINNKPIEVVTSAKLLGLTISNNLK